MRNPIIYSISILIVVLTSFTAYGQNLRYKQFTIENGLPSNYIHKTSVDQEGFLWIESKEGISRFDGEKSHHWDWLDIPSISDLDSLSSLITVVENNIYGVHKGRVHAYNISCLSQKTKEIARTEKNIFIHHQNTFEESELIVLSRDTCLSYSFNVQDSLLYRDQNNSLPLPSNQHSIQLQIGNYSQNEVIFNIKEKGLFKVSINDDFTLKYEAIKSDVSPNHTGIQSISSEEGIWFMHDKQLIKWGEEFKALQYNLIGNINPTSLIVSNGSNVFFSDYQNLFMYELGSNSFYEISQFINLSSKINSLSLDHEDNLWVSTESDGLFCIYHTLFTGYNLGLLGQTPINHLYSTSSLGLLAGTDNGLFLISSGWSKIPLDVLSEDVKVFHIGENVDGVIYASTNQGINSIIQGNPNNCFPEENSLKSFLIDDSNHLTFARDGFLYAYQQCKSKPKAWPLTKAKKSHILIQDDSSKVWMGTNAGLLIYEKGVVTPKSISIADGLPHNKINDIKIGRDRQLYVATDGGISIIHPSSFSIRNFTNLPSLKCRKITIAKNDEIWVYTPNGLFGFSPENEENIQKLSIPVEGVNCLEIDHRNQLWVGTPKGLLSFNTENIIKKEDAPQLFWENILLDNERMNGTTQDLSLSKNSVLHVEYGTVAFRDRRLVSYQYKLNDNLKWQNTKNSNLTLNSLQTGDYHLQVRVQKPNSPWSKPLELKFSVHPPLWQRWGFILPALLVGILFIGLILRNIRKREKKKIETKRRYAELELKALQSQMNPHFIFNTLNAIQHSIIKGNPDQASASLNSFAHLIRLFLESSQSKYIPLKDEIHMLQLYCDLTRLCYEEKFDYTIKVDPNIDLEDVELPTMLIQPHVENAIKHGLLPSKDKGSLQIDFSLIRNVLTCSIKDDGIGREKAQQSKAKSKQIRSSLGNTLTTERAKILNDIYRSDIRIEIKDLKGRRGNPLGTDVKLIIPLE